MLAERASRVVSLGLSALAFAMAAGCGSGDDSTAPPGGGGGSGGSTTTASGGSSGTPATGGTMTPGTGAGGGDAAATSDGGMTCPPPPATLFCTPAVAPAQALIADFTLPEAGPVAACDGIVGPNAFGTYGADLFGGTYVYPTVCVDACNPTAPPQMFPLNEDLSAGNWHITGSVGTYSGMGLWVNRNIGPGPTEGTFAYTGLPGHVIDASAYSGISFTISGDAGPSGVVIVGFTSRATTPALDGSLHTTCGICPTAMGCGNVEVSIPVTATATPTTVTFAQANILDPEAFMSLSWRFTPPAGAGTATAAAYPINITIDDIAFVPR